jgi:hypothetical protein
VKHKPLTFEGGKRYVNSLGKLETWTSPATRNLMVGVDMFGNARYADGMVHDEGKSSEASCLISRTRRSTVEAAIAQALADAYGEGVHDGMNK